jgi:hypothetical protein
MKRTGMATIAWAVVFASGVATAQSFLIVEAQPQNEVLLTEQSRDGFNTGRPTLVEVAPDYSLVDRSRVNDVGPGDVVVLHSAVPVPQPRRVGPANSGTNPTGTELQGQNSGQ